MASTRLVNLDIPSKFRIMHHTIRVKEIPDLPEAGKYGDYDADLNEIRLFTKDVCDDVLIHTFYHELIHCLEDKGNLSSIEDEEARCDVLGGLLAQYVQTKVSF